MLSNLIIEDAVRAALKEDLAQGYDVTSYATIPGDAQARGVLRARAPGCLAGLVPALSAFMLTDPDFAITVAAQDGEFLQAGQDIAIIEGPARAMMTAERTALNFLIHLSGVATLTALYVDSVKHTSAQITCTRKTLPGLRAFQKYAVRCGGGSNHRYGLGDAVLIKDNHIAAVGGIKEALTMAEEHAGHTLKIEIEVETLDQLKEVLKHGGADIVMFDNMDVKTMKKAVKMVDGAMITEASGGVRLENVAAIAETGVDFISVGALTHSAPALDIGLDIDA